MRSSKSPRSATSTAYRYRESTDLDWTSIAIARRVVRASTAMNRVVRLWGATAADSGPVPPTHLAASLADQQQVLDDASDTRACSDFEHAGHWQSGAGAFVGVVAQRRHVVRDEHPSLLGGPFEYCRVVCS
jgi:hypothetical protein